MSLAYLDDQAIMDVNMAVRMIFYDEGFSEWGPVGQENQRDAYEPVVTDLTCLGNVDRASDKQQLSDC